MLGALLCATVASAQPTDPIPAAEGEAIVPPRLIGTAVIEYPPGAQGNQDVVLHLSVGADGNVSEAVAIKGTEPFTGAAITAVRGLRFEPARRGTTPIAVKIAFQVRFEEPVIAPAADVSAPEAPEAAPPPPSRPIQVSVLGERPEPLAQSLTRAEVRQLPGAFGDPFRAIEALPGVTPILSGVPFFYVRGAPPGNVGYYLDDIRLPILYHVALGPSVVHPGLVSRVDLYPGAYPTRYGRFSGGIVAGEVTEPPDEWRGEWQLRLFDAGLMVEAPLFGGRGHVLVGGRYSYTAYLISLLGEDVRLEYWDYQLRAGYQLGPRDSVRVFTFGSFDYFGEDTPDSDDGLFSMEFHRLDLRHKHEFADQAELESAVTFGIDRTRVSEDTGTALNRRVQVRSAYERRLSPSLELEVGADVTLDDYRIEVDFEQNEDVVVTAPPNPDPSQPMLPIFMPDPEAEAQEDEDEAQFRRLFPSRRDIVGGAFAELSWDADAFTRVVSGVRFDTYSSGGVVAYSLEPRISAEFRITENLTLKNAFGLAAQPPSFVLPIAGFDIGGLPGGLQRSAQSSAGAEYRLPDGMKLKLTLFHNAFFDMTDLLSLARLGDDEAVELLPDTRTQGQAYGLEFMFHRDLTRRLGGFLSYTLSRSVRDTPVGRLASSFDRTHVLNAVVGYDLGRRWRAGGRFVFYTGTPPFTLEDTLTGPRLPPYHRIDVRLEKQWPLGESGGYYAFVLEVLNTTLSAEVIARDCDENGCEDEAIGPITIPSLAFEGRF